MVWVLLVALPALAGHVFLAACLDRLARRTQAGPAWWAWVPGPNLALVARVAGRSPAWSALLLIPGLNLVVWGLLWAEACGRLRRPIWLAVPLCVPVLNLAVLAHLAGLSPARSAVAAVALVLVTVPPAVAGHRGLQAARTSFALRRLEDPDAPTRQAGVRLLIGSGTPARATPALAAALQDGDETVRAEAARALAALGPEAAGAVPALTDALGDDSGLVRGRAARALWTVTDGHPPPSLVPAPLLPALVESAREAGDAEMPDADLVLALAAVGRTAPDRLAAALQDPDMRVRWHAAAALMQLGPSARETARALRRAMDDPEWPVRNAAGRGLEDVADADAVPMLAEAVRDPSAETRYHAARALARVGPAAAPAVPALVAALRDEDWEVRMESAWALASVGPAGAVAEPAVLVALRDPDPQVRASAAWALASIGGSPAAVVPALREAERDPDRQVREAATGALRRALGQRR